MSGGGSFRMGMSATAVTHVRPRPQILGSDSPTGGRDGMPMKPSMRIRILREPQQQHQSAQLQQSRKSHPRVTIQRVEWARLHLQIICTKSNLRSGDKLFRIFCIGTNS